MLNAWRRWCRLCGKQQSEVQVFIKTENILDIAEAIQKHFAITITPFDEMPTMICTKCHKYVSSLMQFADRCSKIDAMFSDLAFGKLNINDEDLEHLRYHYGIDRDDFTAYEPRDMCDQETDTNDLSDKFLHKSENDEHTEILTILVDENSSGSQTNYVKDENIDDITIEEERLVDELGSADDATVDATYLQEECGTEDESDKDNLLVRTDHNTKDKKPKRPKSTNLDVKITCEICDKVFARKTNLRQHLQKVHGTHELLYSCSKCPKKFLTEQGAERHEVVHLPSELKLLYPCIYCDKKFTKSVNVHTHIRAIHIGEKPFICEVCGKRFVTKGALKEHKYTHIEETPYQCSRCPKKFKNMARLKTHEDTHNDTIYVCPHCGLQLNTKRTLQMHMVVHSDQKKYKCQYCGNEYKRSKALKNHLILHSGLRPYSCPFCDKTFANGSNCRSHKKKAHPVELAAMEAAGEVHRVTNIPKLEQLKAVPTTAMQDSHEHSSQEEISSSNAMPSISINPRIFMHTNPNLSGDQGSEILTSLQEDNEISHQLPPHISLQNQLHQFQEQHHLFDHTHVSLNT